jgi:hypothetical protein
VSYLVALHRRFHDVLFGHVVFSSEPAAWLATVMPFVDAAHAVRKGLRA